MKRKSTSTYLLKFTFLLATFVASFTVNRIFGQDTLKITHQIKEKLPVPFGTLVKLKIEIVDGNELNDKGHQSSYLFRVKSVDSIILSSPILIEFKDEAGNLPNNDFELYKYLYDKTARTISSSESEKMKKQYVGKEFNIVAYETGGFTGIPDGYFEYQELRQDYGFHFRQYLIVVADLTKKQNE